MAVDGRVGIKGIGSKDDSGSLFHRLFIIRLVSFRITRQFQFYVLEYWLSPGMNSIDTLCFKEDQFLSFSETG